MLCDAGGKPDSSFLQRFLNRFQCGFWSKSLKTVAGPKFLGQQILVGVDIRDEVLAHGEKRTQRGFGFHSFVKLLEESSPLFPKLGTGGKEFLELIEDENTRNRLAI